VGLTVADFLPYLELPSPGGGRVALRHGGRHATAVVVVHDATCDACRRYVAQVGAAADDLAAWDGRVVVLVPGSLGDAAAFTSALELAPAVKVVATDADDAAALVEGAGVLIADRYGHVYDVTTAGNGHALPAPRELEEWLKFLATQCPE
jgi:hypothetical protein